MADLLDFLAQLLECWMQQLSQVDRVDVKARQPEELPAQPIVASLGILGYEMLSLERSERPVNAALRETKVLRDRAEW